MREQLNSPKIYFITKDNKFYNIREKQWYSAVVNATFDKDKKIMNQLIEMPKYIGCSLHIITEHEFMQEMASQTTNLVIAGEYFHRLLFNLTARIPTISQVNKVMSMKCKNTIDVLFPFSNMHKDFIEQEEEKTDEVQGHYAEYINEMSNVQIFEMGEVVAIIKAYHKDRKSILGIAKKTLNH